MPTLATIGEEEEDWEEFDSDEKAEHPVDFEPIEVMQQRWERDVEGEDESERDSDGESAERENEAAETKSRRARAKWPSRPPATTREAGQGGIEPDNTRPGLDLPVHRLRDELLATERLSQLAH